MKSSQLQIAQWLMINLFLLITVSVFSQRAITWKGGAPGKKNDWYCPQNWSSTSVPDEFSDVIIPDVSTSSFALPCIQSGEVEVNSITIQSNGGLTILKNAMMVVLEYTDGVSPKNVKGEGLLMLNNNASMNSKSMVVYKANENQFN